MDFLQRPPDFVGQSALHNSEIQSIPISNLIINTTDFNRPRDSKRFVFIEIVVSGNYTDILGYSTEFETTPGGNFTAKGNDAIIFNSITKKSYSTIIVNSTYSIPDGETTIVIKSSDLSISKIQSTNNSWNDWVLILSCGLDWTKSISECPEATDLKASLITKNSVRLNWKSSFGAEINYIRIKERNMDSWTIYTTPGSNTSINIGNLNSNTTYDWQLCTSCELNKNNFYSATQTFETQP
jgi:hypothetical protein